MSAPEAIDGTYDPFEEFNRSVGAGVVEDPYPLLAMARAKGPVQKENLEAELLSAEVDPQVTMGPEVFTAFSYDAVQTVLRDGETFSSAGYADVMGAVMGHTILEMDEPEHHTYRGLVQQAFSRKAMERWETEVVVPIVDECIDAFVDRGRAELVRELTLPFPVNVIARMLGLPREDLPQFHRWAIELISVSFDWDRGTRASAQLRDYFACVLADRRAHPADDLMSTLAAAELDGQHLTDEETFAFLRLLLPAGAETTYRSSSNLLFGLLTHPDQLDALRADRALMPQAIEEGLRWEPPLTTIVRTATHDTVVDGVEIPAQAIVITNMGSANHDEKYWERSEEFDIHREQRQHLARMETRVVLERLFDRLPNLRLDPAADAPHITGMTFRAPPALPVLFD